MSVLAPCRLRAGSALVEAAGHRIGQEPGGSH